MARPKRFSAAALLTLAFAACAAPAKRPLVDPFPLRFPLAEAGSLMMDGVIQGQPWARDGIIYWRTRDGPVVAVVASSQAVLSVSAASPSPAKSARPSDGPVLVREGSLLRAEDGKGASLWEFRASGAIPADPVVAGGRVFFGDAERMFYALRAKDGKVLWRRRLQGAPLHRAVVGGGVVAVAASNSVVYRLAGRGGSILSWQAVPSRVVYEPVAAGRVLLISSASPTITAIDLGTGRPVGAIEASGPLVAGAVFCPPFIALFVGDEARGGLRIVFFRSP